MSELFFKWIEASEVITIFRHVGADSDALGSQFGLKTWILDQYPNKQVYALGEDLGSQGKLFPPIDDVADEVIANSLAIILDTANAARIDDARWQLAAKKIKVDHHLEVEHFGDLEIVKETAGATCEILASLFQKDGRPLSSTAANYLYGGLIADTLQFSIASTTSDTLLAAAYLAQCHADIPRINRENFSKTLKEFQFETFIRSHYKLLDGHLAYIILHAQDYEQFGLTRNEAKEKVYALGNVNEFEVWALFIEQAESDKNEPLYQGSLRSKQTAINDIANAFNGGGHKLACGVKRLSPAMIEALLQQLLRRIKKG